MIVSPLSSWRHVLWAVVVLGLILRATLIARAARQGPLDDPDNYLPLARSLIAGNGFALDGHPTAYRPPLYPLLLAVSVKLAGETWGVAGLHLVLGVGTIAATALTARRWGYGPRLAIAAAAVVAFDPVLAAQSRSVMTETCAAFLTALTLASLALPGRQGILLGGFGFGLASLCRPSAWPPAVLTAGFALIVRPGTARRRLGRAVALFLITVAVASPWAIRNAFVLGEPVWTTTHGGYTLFLANNPVYYDEVVNGPPGSVWTGHNQWLWWDSVNRSMRGLSEPKADRAMRASAVRFIASRPGDFGRASLARLGRFWGLAPSGVVYPRAVRVASACWTLPLWVALGLGLVRRDLWTWPRVGAPAVVLGLSLVHAVYWTDQRMRAPAVPAIALIAAGSAGRAGRDAKKGRNPMNIRENVT